jgi:hypothetical protein
MLKSISRPPFGIFAGGEGDLLAAEPRSGAPRLLWLQ